MQSDRRTLADLYDEILMPPELRKAHLQNDKAVMQAYGFSIKETTEEKCVADHFGIKRHSRRERYVYGSRSNKRYYR